VQEVFTKAQQAVVYPFRPLFDLNTGQLTVELKKALTRIFRMYDQDHDGLLSNAELDAFQYQTFRLPLLDKDLAGWKKVVSRNNNTTHEVVKDGKFTVVGFLAIFDVFISQNRLDVPWKVLRKFGYSDELELRLPTKSSSSSPKLSIHARHFLAALFQQFDANGDGELSSEDLVEIFSIVPDPALPPWHPLRAPQLLEGCFSLPAISSNKADSDAASKDNSMELSVSASGITIASSAASLPTVGDYHNLTPASSLPTLEPMSFLDWMGHWHMLATISPTVARAELYRLGHVSTTSSDGRNNNNKRRSNPYLSLPSEELRILVVGSQGCGKTTLLRLLCGGGDDGETEPTTHPETTTTHKKFKRNKSSSSESSKTKSSKLEESTTKDSNDDDSMVVHFIFTEVPRDADQMAWAPLVRSAKTRPLVVFCYDSKESLGDAMEMEKNLLEDEVARVFCVARTADADTSKEAAEHCQELDLEPPLVVDTADRNVILNHLARCGLTEKSGLALLKSKPHAEQKKREAARRRKMIWLGGLVSVSVAVAVGVLWGSVTKGSGEERKAGATSRFSWLADMIFGGNSVAVATTTEMAVDA
jgi:Ras family protein T1